MLKKLKRYFGLDELAKSEPTQTDSTLIELKALKAENRELKEIIRKQRTLLQELSEENMELGRDRQRYADMVASQSRLIDVYSSKTA